VRRWRLLALLLLAVVLAYTSVVSKRPQTFSGTVVKVHDGDTITVARGGVEEKVRLDGVDCPELSQHYGPRAREFTAGLCLDKPVTVKVFTKDRYERSVADVSLPDGRSLNQELVKNGLAWWYEQYAKGDKTLQQLQEEARGARRGLWAEKNPVAPWTYRHGDADARTPEPPDATRRAVAGGKPAPAALESVEAALNVRVTLQAPYPDYRAGPPTEKISIQYAVIEVARQAGLRYNWKQSYENTNPICRRFIKPDIRDEKCSDALNGILDPAGLRYTIVDGEIVLEKK